MPTISQLSAVTSLSGSDLLPVYSAQNGDARKASLNTLLDWIETAWISPTAERATASPTLAGFTFALPSTGSDIFAILTPTGTMATGTVLLPPASSVVDGQTVIVYSSQAVGALTVDGNTLTVNGAPAGLAAGSSFTLRYDKTSSAWYAISQSGNGTAVGTFTATLKGTTDPTTAVTATGRYSIAGRALTLSVAFEGVNTTGASGDVTITTTLSAALRPLVRAVGSVGLDSFNVSHHGTFSDFLTTGVIAIMQNRTNLAASAVTHNAGTPRTLIVTGTYIIA